MNKRFSLATLMLIIAIAAVESAGLRVIYEHLVLESRGAATPNWTTFQFVAGSGAVLGALFGLVLAIWNRSGWLRGLASVAAGFFLGLGAGAQCTMRVDWPVMLAAPAIMIPLTLLIALNSRRRARSRAAALMTAKVS